MIPRELTLRGFLSYRDEVVVDLSQIKVACVSGANGAGKSTLFDAMTWALFGRARRNDDAVITDGMESCQVVFEFSYENEDYRVERTKSRGQGTTLEFQIKNSDENWKPLTETGVRATEERIKDVLRLDYDTFVNASFFLQGKADMFAVQTPGKRKEILSSILGLEVWEAYRDETARRRRILQNEVALQQSRLKEVIDELNEEETRRETLKTLEDLLAKTTSLKTTKTELLVQARAQMKQLEADLEKIDLLSDQSATIEHRLAETTDLLAARDTQLARIEKILQTADEIKESYRSWLTLREKLSKLDALSTQYNQLMIKKEELNGKIRAEAARLSQERLSLGQQLQDISLLKDQLPDIQRSLEEKNTRIKKMRLELENIDQIEAELDGQKQRKADLSGENNQLKEKMAELKERIVHLESAHGADCPLCGQDLTADHKQNMLESLNEDGKSMGDLHRKNSAAIEQYEVEIQRLLKELDVLKEVRLNLSKLESEAGITNQQLEEKTARIGTWEEKGAPRLNEIVDLLDKSIFEKEARKELIQLEEHISGLGYDPNDHEKIRAEELELRGIEDDYRQLEQARTEQEGLSREINEFEKQIAQQKDDLDKNLLSKETFQKQVDEQRKLLPDITEFEKEVSLIEKEDNDLRMRVGGAQQAVAVLKDQRKRKLQFESEINENNRLISQLKMLEVAFGKDGIPALLIEQSLPKIEEQANEVLDRLSNNGMSVSFETQREYRDKKREDKKQTLDIIIRDGAGSREYEMFSGGEVFRINFAIRLALSRVLAQRSGARLQTLVIDEGFGSQDAEGRQRLIEAINLVSSDFEKILVITHLEELKDVFPSRIEVTKTLSGSSVEVIP
ncbi:MAG: SMC family ATPase [Pelolinea sp.]|nr:SMC family ATPase [Pelolinea sp.]